MITKNKLREIIREALNEMGQARKNPLDSVGDSIINFFFNERSQIKNWRIGEYDGVIEMKIYFNLLKQSSLQSISKVIEKLNAQFRMYPEDNLICVELKFNRRVKKTK